MRFPAGSATPDLAPDDASGFLSVTRTADELSIICSTIEADKLAAPKRSDGWRCFKIEGATAPSDVPGIIASVVTPLATAGLSVFAVASFDTDHVLVEDVGAAASALVAEGHTVRRSGTNPSPSMDQPASRPAVAADVADLVLLADAATRRLFSWIWTEDAAEGQSGLECARDALRTDRSSVYHYTNWDVIERDGGVIAGLNSFVMAPVSNAALRPTIAPVVVPLNELKRLAEGTWYISAASVFPEGRGTGVGTTLLKMAERKARAAGIAQVTLMVGSFNAGARRLYERHGFVEWDRRHFVAFPGSDPEGWWILMVKDLED